MGIQPALSLAEIYQFIELSNKLDVEFSNSNGELLTTYEDCFFCKSNNPLGFAFAIMSDSKCLEFYVTEKDRVDIFILDLGDDKPSKMGRSKYKSEIRVNEILGDVVVIDFEMEDFNLKLKIKQHKLKMNPERMSHYISTKGDSLNLKYLAARNIIERMKWDSMRREVSLAGIENKEITQFWDKIGLYSMNIGGADEFSVEYVNIGGGESKSLLINLVDENNQIPIIGEYTSLGYRVSMMGDDILRLKAAEVKRFEDHEEIIYFFDENPNAVALHIAKDGPGKAGDYAYEMFTAIIYQN
ncbi:hypothetical protein [Pseudomonas orientalis]|uniref:Uncharacterized protein n=1 Tax=Pseudomonas orientalis TaxID=76758 RepID=A0A2L0RT73_9PSED|nr:hypothetical protein [Pseudomonas orientalis]AUZ45335.1 hypothetical protein BOP93_06910 [Pseudomonas orientalis]